jgi:Caspase domain
MAGLAERPTLMNFIQAAQGWRDAAATNPDGMAFFYFAGHGLQRTKDDAVLLLDEFGGMPPGADPLVTSVDLRTLFYGMAPSTDFPNVARTQLYVVDACRNHPKQFNNFEQLHTAGVFQVALSGRDDRIAPIFYAAVPDSKGYAIAGRHTVFSQQLLRCLESGAARPGAEDATGNPGWEVTIHSLIQALTDRFNQLTPAEKADQDFTVGGQVKEAVLYRLPTPPQVELSLACDPEGARTAAQLEVLDAFGQPILSVSPLEPHPYQKTLAAGLYQLRTTFQGKPGFKDWTRLTQLMPPGKMWTMKVQ